MPKANHETLNYQHSMSEESMKKTIFFQDLSFLKDKILFSRKNKTEYLLQPWHHQNESQNLSSSPSTCTNTCE